MTQFQLFDSVQLVESVPLVEGDIAPEGTPGAIVEVFNQGEAFLVELFGCLANGLSTTTPEILSLLPKMTPMLLWKPSGWRRSTRISLSFWRRRGR